MKCILPYLILTEPNGVISHFHLHVKKQTHGVKLAKTKQSDPSLPDYDVIMSFKWEPLGVLSSIEKYKRNQYFLRSAINLSVLTDVETVVGKEKLQM